MKKLIGLNKINTAIFFSGMEVTLKNLIKFSLSKNSPINIKLAVTNNPNGKRRQNCKKI